MAARRLAGQLLVAREHLQIVREAARDDDEVFRRAQWRQAIEQAAQVRQDSVRVRAANLQHLSGLPLEGRRTLVRRIEAALLAALRTLTL